MKQGYFERQNRLMGEESLAILQGKKVAIIGSGGLGCSIGIALAGSGIGVLHLVDFDTVAWSNIHRQIAFSSKDVGRAKSEALRDHLQARASGESRLEIEVFQESLCDYAKRGESVDLIMDATDNLPARVEINALAKRLQIPWLYASVEAWHGQVALLDRADFSGFKVSDRTPEGVATPTVMMIAALASSLALRFLSGLTVERDRLHYCTMNGGLPQISSYQMAL